MGRHKLSQSEFEKRVKDIYGDFFDLSKADYQGYGKHITIISDKFGEERILPGQLLHLDLRKRSRIKGRRKETVIPASLRVWFDIKDRCYGGRERNASYNGCSMCDEWNDFRNFDAWYQKNHIDGYQIDKDIIKRGNKIYCEEYCCFVPREINLLVAGRGKRRTAYPPGVQLTDSGKYSASIWLGNKIRYLGRFKTASEAFEAYKTKKEKHIKDVAREYFYSGKIEKRVYDALMKYEVEMTD